MQDQPNKKLQNKLMEAAGGGWGGFGYSAGFETNSQPALWQTSDHSTVEGSRLYTDVALIIGA